ncbi:hypothetical protein GCM10027258_50780 [Amycolatopsis stemonae]
MVGGCEPGPGPSGGASDAGAGFVDETAVVVAGAAGTGVEHAVSSASAAAATRIPPRFPIS